VPLDKAIVSHPVSSSQLDALGCQQFFLMSAKVPYLYGRAMPDGHRLGTAQSGQSGSPVADVRLGALRRVCRDSGSRTELL